MKFQIKLLLISALFLALSVFIYQGIKAKQWKAIFAAKDCHCDNAFLELRRSGGSTGSGKAAINFAVRNNGSTACCLKGYPKVELFDDRGKPVSIDIQQSGKTYFMDSAPENEVTIKPHKEAMFQIAYTEGKYGDECTPVSLIRVTLPGSKTSMEIKASFRPCSQVQVTAVQK